MKGIHPAVRAFALGFGIGTLICLVVTGLLTAGLNGQSDEGETPVDQLQTGFEAESGEQAGTEYSVIVKIKLSDDDMGSEDELEAGFVIESLLMNEFEKNPALGEFDGDGVGFGYLDIYMYTTNPEYVVGEIMPIVRGNNPPSGSHIITHITETGAEEKRYDV